MKKTRRSVKSKREIWWKQNKQKLKQNFSASMANNKQNVWARNQSKSRDFIKTKLSTFLYLRAAYEAEGKGKDLIYSSNNNKTFSKVYSTRMP